MRLRDLETRIVRLERDPAHSSLARLSEDELNGEIVGLLNQLVSGHATYDALIAEVASMPEPDMPECARLMRWYLYDYVPREQPQLVR